MAIFGITSQTSAVWHVGAALSTLSIGFGINAVFRPRAGFEVFEFEYPKAAKEQKLVDGLMLIYGIRDVFMGVVLLAAYYYGAREVFGWSLIASSAVAFVDGVANQAVLGYGAGKHWGYAPVLTVVGSILLGAVDGL